MFSLEQLLFSVALDIRTNVEILETVLPMLKEVYDREIKSRAEIQVRDGIMTPIFYSTDFISFIFLTLMKSNFD